MVTFRWSNRKVVSSTMMDVAVIIVAAGIIFSPVVQGYQIIVPPLAASRQLHQETSPWAKLSSATTWSRSKSKTNLFISSSKDDGEGKKDAAGEKKEQEYLNFATEFLSNFMSGNGGGGGMKDEDPDEAVDPLSGIDFGAPKLDKKLDLNTLAAALDCELYDREWFVTGNVNPAYFDDSFVFRDPDVTLSGIDEYARGVNRLFDQETSRAEIISTVVDDTKDNTITCTWRLSGKVNIGPGLTIKPYVVSTDFTVDEKSGLIVYQEDRFDIPQWDILLSALFPFLVGVVTSPPAPPVTPREVVMPKI